MIDWNWHGLIEAGRAKRSAEIIKKKKITITNPETGEAVCEGSGKELYNVTLDTCDCVDFDITHGTMACKHIIALGILLDAFTLPNMDELNSSLRALPLAEHLHIILAMRRAETEPQEIKPPFSLEPCLFEQDGKYVTSPCSAAYIEQATAAFERRLADKLYQAKPSAVDAALNALE